MGSGEITIIYLAFIAVIAFILWYLYKDVISRIGIDDGTLVEDKLDKNVIPTTRKWGIIIAFISGGILILTSEVFSGVVTILIGVSSTIGFVILLEGFSNIIRLLRKISEK